MFALFLLLQTVTFSQTNSNIELKNNELASIKSQILKLENELKDKQANEVQTLKILDKISQQTHLLNRIIREIAFEEQQIEKRISSISNQIEKLKKELSELKKEYSEYVKWLYVNNKESKWDFLFKSDSFYQAIMRYKYFNYITERNAKKVDLINSNQNKLEKSTLALKLENEEKQKIENEKINEVGLLEKKRKEKTELVAKLNKVQKNIEKEIDEKRKYEIEIKARIAKLIEEERERERKAREEKFNNKSTEPFVPKVNYAKFQNFSELKGKMTWPVASGNIVRDFGENQNKKLKTVTLNYGIDIKSKPNEQVFAVAEGVVSVIDWIVGFGSIIIITHKGNFRTVYGHIDNIEVKENDIVKAGTKLGTVNQSLEGNIVHFEIWDERNYQNPQLWLVKK